MAGAAAATRGGLIGRGAGGRGLICLLAFLAAFLPLPAVAALPDLVKGTAPAAAPVRDGAADADAVRTLINEARRELVAIEASPGLALNAPAGTSNDDLKLRRFYLNEIIRTYERDLGNLTRLEGLRAELREALEKAERWKAFETPPPYSLPYVDSLLRQEQVLEKRQKFLADRLELLADFREQLSTSMRKAASDLRQAEERLQQGSPTASAWSMELSRLRLRVQTALLQSAATSEEINRAEFSVGAAEAALARRKALAAQASVAFPESDFRKIQAELDAENARVSEALADAQEAASRAVAEREKTQEASTAAMARHFIGDAPATAAALKLLDDRARAAQLRAESAEIVLDALRYQPIILELKRQAWEFRYRLHQKPGPELVAEAKLHYQRAARALSLFSRSAERQLALVGAETDSLQSRVETPELAADRPELRRRLAALTEREQKLRAAFVFISSAQEVLNRLGDELDIRREAQSKREYFADVAAAAGDFLNSIWNFELFVAEDTIEVAGKKVTGTTSVTLGKILRALLMLSAGILLTTWLGRLSERIAVERFAQDAANARILRKWMSWLGVIVLILGVLLWVNIPLSVFAFLGGTIAIGLGFGMQNLLKNLISGLMLLFERPFRPGDLIEVGSLTGVVTEVGIRASTIHHANGIDTLVPNSTFLEQNVTNWMYENPKARFCVEVGVAYGSPVKEVTRLLFEAMKRHSLILEDPEPEVLFQKFGADSLEFGLYFWLALSDKVLGRRVSSDLHFIIEKSLGEHGIVIAYPQREVHFDPGSPLRVEVVSAAPAAQATATDDGKRLQAAEPGELPADLVTTGARS